MWFMKIDFLWNWFFSACGEIWVTLHSMTLDFGSGLAQEHNHDDGDFDPVPGTPFHY